MKFPILDWFPGWSDHNNYNKQPNDDGEYDRVAHIYYLIKK